MKSIEMRFIKYINHLTHHSLFGGNMSFVIKNIKSILIMLALPAILSANTYTVTNTNETGNGSLTWAMTQAAANPGADTIEFAIPTSDPNYSASSGTFEIECTTALPDITDDNTHIDGHSQAGNIGNTNADGLEIVILSNRSPVELPAISIYSAYNTIEGICIGKFRAHHFWIEGENAHHNIIRGCLIGTDPDGNQSYVVQKSNGVNIREGAHHNVIGGVGEDRNIMGGFYYEAIEMVLNVHDNKIIGNYIGVNKSGISELPIGWGVDVTYGGPWAGMYIRNGSYSNQVGGSTPDSGNVMCACGRQAIIIKDAKDEGTDNNLIQYNYIGVGADGQTALPNGEGAIWIVDVADGTKIKNNVLSGNTSNAVEIRGAHNTVMENNYIGSSADGSTVVPNTGNGLVIMPEAKGGLPDGNIIGPGNVIVGQNMEPDLSYAAIKMTGAGNFNTTIKNNYLGTNATQTLISGYDTGIMLFSGASQNFIGTNNVITGHGYYGIWIKGEDTINNTISQNSIYNNGEFAILIQTGLNALVPAPQITGANKTTITGTTIANSTVELFSDNGTQAQTYLGKTTSSATGNFTWNGTISQSHATATVTDANGNTSMLSTGSVVPVELVSFSAQATESNSVILNWKTATESNTLGFYIEKESGDKFQQIGFEKAAGTSTQEQCYSFTDNSPDQTNSYRLKMTDLDGSSTYSETVTVTLQTPDQYKLSMPYPNPFNSSTVISYSLPKSEHVTLTVYNTLGQKVQTLYNGEQQAGQHRLIWNSLNSHNQLLSTGVYFIEMKTPGYRSLQKLFYVK